MKGPGPITIGNHHFTAEQTRTAAGIAAATVIGGVGLYAIRRQRRLAVPTSGPYPAESLPAGAYDAVIVGGGPSGSTCGYYLSKAGAKVRLVIVACMQTI